MTYAGTVPNLAAACLVLGLPSGQSIQTRVVNVDQPLQMQVDVPIGGNVPSA